MKRSPVLIVLTVGLVLGLAGPAWAATPYKDISSTGPLTNVYLGDELSCQIRHQADGTTGEFYPPSGIPADCGTLLAVGPSGSRVLYAPDFPNHSAGSAAGGLGARTPFTPVSQTTVSGSGTSGSPYQVVTIVDVGTSGLRITQTDSYVVGEESYRTDIQVANTGTSAQSATLYRAADCYLGGSDSGFGIVDTTTKSVGCRESEGGVPGDRIEQWVPITGGNNYYQASFGEVWTQIGTKGPFPDTCECATNQDNGAGISWDLTIPVGQSATRSHITTFSPQGQQALTTDKTAESPESPPGGSNGYTITVSNPNVGAVELSSITDTLPDGFTYTPGSTSGVTSTDPSIAGQELTWSGSFSVPGGGSVTLEFAVTVANAPGDYLNQATADAGTITVVPTGPTASITVTGPLSIDKTANNPTSQPGDQNGYTITVSNPNTHAVNANSISDTLPDGFSYETDSTSGATSDNPSQEGSTLTWDGPFSVAAEGSITLSFVVNVSDTPGEYDNEASVVFEEDSSSTGPTARIVVEEPSDISKTADDSHSQVSTQNGYTITITNPSQESEGEGEGFILDTVTYDTITDTLPDGFTYVDGSTTGLTEEDPDIVGQTLTWNGSFPIPSESQGSLHFNVIVSDTPGDYDNEAAAIQGESPLSTGPTATITVEGPASIEKEADSPTSEVGTQNGYTIFVTNPTEESDIVALDTITYDSITDTLPAGFSYVPNSTTGLTTANPDIVGQTLTWDGPFDIPSETTESLHFNVLVSGTPGQYFNEAAVQEGESELDTDPTAPIDVTAAPVPPVPPVPGPVSLPCDPITAEGGPGGDRMIGGIGADRIRALGGRDIVDTGAGDDEICGGEGGDFLYGRSGFDVIRGEGGNDRLYGGLDADTLYGDAGHDALIGGKAADTFFTQDGVQDCIQTGKGQDTVTGDVGLDLVDPRGGCPPGFWL